jgi:hypothetical protein
MEMHLKARGLHFLCKSMGGLETDKICLKPRPMPIY